MNAKDWVNRDDLQSIINKWAFEHYITGKNEKEYALLESFSKDYLEWFISTKQRPTSKGYEVSSKGYSINLVEQGGIPIYIEVNQPYVRFRVNLYRTSKQYTVDILDTGELQPFWGKIGQLVGG